MSTASFEFDRLVAIMARLRGPDGCPWDREQTIDSLKKYVLEETYEVLETIDRRDHEALCGELGDFLLQVVFLAQVEHEAGHFSIAEVARGIADKLIRRHPHVFERIAGQPALDTANQVRARWEAIKADERGGARKAGTLLSGISAAQPALLRAHQIGARAASVGFDWHHAGDIVDKMREEVEEIREVVAGKTRESADRLEEEIGDLLFAIANLARKLDVDAETALRKASDKFTRRFTTMERRVADSGRKLLDMSAPELEAEWQQTKILPK
jgi:MazG family protein